MPNSSSSKYVKRRAHRHTKSRRHAKKYTVKKVMRGCSSKQHGGGTVALSLPPNATPGAVDAITQASALTLRTKTLAEAGNPEPYTPTNVSNTVPSSQQKGGYKSKHRRRRYKKSIGRKGRSRRFRGSRK
jgi:hypothetical protein